MDKYEALVAQAAAITDDQFRDKLAGLTRLNSDEIGDVLLETGTDGETLAKVLAEVEKAWMYNEEEADGVKRIAKGVSVLMSLLRKFL